MPNAINKKSTRPAPRKRTTTTRKPVAADASDLEVEAQIEALNKEAVQNHAARRAVIRENTRKLTGRDVI